MTHIAIPKDWYSWRHIRVAQIFVLELHPEAKAIMKEFGSDRVSVDQTGHPSFAFELDADAIEFKLRFM